MKKTNFSKKEELELKESDIRFTTFSTIFLITLIPVLLLFWVLTADSSKELKIRDDSYISDFRDEKINSIGTEFSDSMELLELTSSKIIFDFLFKFEKTPKFDEINNISIINEIFSALYLYDKNRTPISDLPDDPYFRIVTENLIECRFSEPKVVDFLSFPDNQSLLCIFQKHIFNGRVLGYSAILLNFSFLQSQLSIPEGLGIDIYNEEYQLTATSTNTQLGIVSINDLTRAMIDGYSDIMIFEEKVYSYGYINLGETSLYLTVYKNLDSYGRQSLSGKFSLIFFLLILLFSVFLTAWKLYKEILKYGEKILVKKAYSKDIRFFNRLKENLGGLINNAKVFEQIDNKLKYLENDIEYIIDNIPESIDEEAE